MNIRAQRTQRHCSNRPTTAILGAGLALFHFAGHAFAQKAPASKACIPNCRSGYTCASGQCISMCNPVCAVGEKCTDTGECVGVNVALPPPPTGPTPVPFPAAAPSAPALGAPYAPAPSAPYPPGPPPGPAAPGAPAAANPAPYAYPPGPTQQPTAPPPGSAEGPPAAPPSSTTGAGLSPTYLHDGFYLRLGLGLGYLTSPVEVQAPPYNNRDIHVSGLSLVSELAIGGTPAPGLVVGGAVYGATVPSPTYDSDPVSLDGGTIGVTMIGPFVDYYLDPSKGLHFQGSVGVALATAASGDFPPEDQSGAGIGAMAGIGYETWVSPQWSVGGVARLIYANPTVKGSDSGDETKTSILIPGALLTATFH